MLFTEILTNGHICHNGGSHIYIYKYMYTYIIGPSYMMSIYMHIFYWRALFEARLNASYVRPKCRLDLVGFTPRPGHIHIYFRRAGSIETKTYLSLGGGRWEEISGSWGGPLWPLGGSGEEISGFWRGPRTRSLAHGRGPGRAAPKCDVNGT